MVSSGRSRRCFRCRQRKVKCGEQRPACDTCVSRGEICPGYSPFFEFRDGFSRQSDAQALSDEPSSSSAATRRKKQRDLVLVHYGGHSGTFTRPHTAPLLPASPLPNDPASRLQATLLYLMDHRLPEAVRLDIYGIMFLDALPARIGVSPALDAAVDAMCVWHRGQVGMERDEIKGLRTQTRALARLREELESPAGARSSETLCAALILSGIQRFVSPSHRNGVYALLRHRGPPMPTDPDAAFYTTLVLSAQGLAWAKSIADGTDCLLDAPAWQASIAAGLHASTTNGRRYGIARTASPLVARFPRLLADVQAHHAAITSHPSPSSPADDTAAAAAAAATTLAARVRAWRRDSLTPAPGMSDLQLCLRAAVGLAPRANPAWAVPLSNETLAYLVAFAAGFVVTRRLLSLLVPRSRFRADEATRATAEREIAALHRLLGEAVREMRKRDVRSWPYMNSSTSVMFAGVNRLDGEGSWEDVLRGEGALTPSVPGSGDQRGGDGSGRTG